MAQNRFDPFIIFLLAISLSINVFLGWKLRSVNAPQILELGTKLPAILAKSQAGTEEVLSFSHVPTPTVIYVVTPTCNWCDRNMANIKAIAHQRAGQYRFVGLSLSSSGLSSYVSLHDLSFPVYSGLTHDTVRTLKLGNTPQTIVVSKDGEVLKNWVGAYTGDLQTEIETYFQARLPGLSSKD